jgi:micrococcal nuclease
MSSKLARMALSALLLVVLSAAACAGSDETAERDTATIERIADGDTLVLEGGSRVRLVQIDAPELGEGECYAKASARELATLVRPGARVALEVDRRLDDVDRHGRLLRYVHSDETNVNVELVRRGAAAAYFFRGERGRHAGRLLAATEEARAESRGLWGACRVTWSPERPVTTRSR